VNQTVSIGITGRFRTASGSDRIICHFPFSIFHLLIVGHGAMTNESSKWPMVNGNEKWKMIQSLPRAVLKQGDRNMLKRIRGSTN